MKNQDCNLTNAFSDSLFGNLIDPALDIIESPIDDLFDDGLIKEIPFAKSIYAIGKTFVGLREKYLYKKTVAFIQELNRDEVSDERLQKHINDLSNKKKYQAECERVLLYIDSCNHILQSKYLSRFYLAYLKGEIDWDVFQELAEVNLRMFVGDYRIMQITMVKGIVSRINEDNASSIQRLSSTGLLSDFIPFGLSDAGVSIKRINDRALILTPLGQLFGQYLDKVDFNSRKEICNSLFNPRY